MKNFKGTDIPIIGIIVFLRNRHKFDVTSEMISVFLIYHIVMAMPIGFLIYWLFNVNY